MTFPTLFRFQGQGRQQLDMGHLRGTADFVAFPKLASY